MVRENRDGTLVSLVDGLLVAEHADPIEKKPLYHVLPGTLSHSIASAGCNFRCEHCQNVEIAKYNDHGSGKMPGAKVTPEQTVAKAVANGCKSIAYTYTEPTVWIEYALETCKKAVEVGLYNIFVTNGYISAEALSMAAPFLHAANIDLKGFTDDFYRKICGARLEGVLECIRDYRKKGIWIEITTLLIPGLNDDKNQLEGIASFIANEPGTGTPWHISRFFPHHHITDRPPTPGSSFERAYDAAAKAGLQYIYEGNIQGGREQTYCPGCGTLLIGRQGYRITTNRIKDGSCSSCGKTIPGIWG